MTMMQEYLEEVKERIAEMTDDTIRQAGLDPDDFSKPDVIDRLWYEYQKSLREYDVDDPDFAFDNAVKEVLGKSVLGIA